METASRATIVCDVSTAETSFRMVERLARLRLAALRTGRDVQLRDAPRELEELLDLAGLSDVLPVEAGRKAEERKDPLGLEEEGQLDDPAA